MLSGEIKKSYTVFISTEPNTHKWILFQFNNMDVVRQMSEMCHYKY